MSYRLEHRRSIGQELQRLVRKELRAAIARLEETPPDEASVHEARKSVKKVRAIVKLLRAPLGAHYSTENERLRAVARRLSRLRDADASLETLDALYARYPTVLGAGAKRRMQRGLQNRKRDVRRRTGALVGPAIVELRRARKTLPARIASTCTFSKVRAGVARGYERARAAGAHLSIDSDAVAFHRWRRRVKDHWYHVRLFAGRHSTPRARSLSLRRLESDLGDGHNVALFNDILLAEPDRFADARTTALVLGCIQKRQRTLRAQALARGHRLFAGTTRAFREAVASWWHPKRTRYSTNR
jgi:CHAD domain-containing protein